MLMTKIFDFTVNDVDDGDRHYDRYCDQVDYQDHTITIDDEFDTTCTMIFDTTTCTTYTAISDTFIKYHTTSDQLCTTTDYGTHCDCDNNQDHTIKHLNYDISMMILHDQDDDLNDDYMW